MALVLALNLGIDPPDVIKISPCARMECWIEPEAYPPDTAVDLIGKALREQVSSRILFSYHSHWARELILMGDDFFLVRTMATKSKIQSMHRSHGGLCEKSLAFHSKSSQNRSSTFSLQRAGSSLSNEQRGNLDVQQGWFHSEGDILRQCANRAKIPWWLMLCL